MDEAQASAEETEACTRVQVVVRVRPVLPNESVSDTAVTCSSDGTRVQVLLPERAGSSKEALPGANRSGARAYEFDACLPGNTTQPELFEVCGLQELVEAALDGYSVTIFAFGQTGSGKTHTMIGPRLSRAGGLATVSGKEDVASLVVPDDGVLPRCMAAAYAGIEQRSDTTDYTVSVSCIELYNEAVTDLLGDDKSKQLQVRKEASGSFRVDGLSQTVCKTAGGALKTMAKALQFRHTRAHALNNYSSRSHCLMTFNFASKEKQAAEGQAGSQGGLRRYGKLVLVDLAGSERLRETGNTAREAVRETGSINKSLFTLGQVLASLATRSSRGEGAAGALPVHIPFRDSKLTQLLWDGLRGSGRALMLACLGPMKQQGEESLNTLHFASVALRIKAQPVILLDPQDQLVLELRNTIRQLQEENRQLAVAMAQLSTGADAATVFGSLPEKLRLAAARDGLVSAPGPSTRPPPSQVNASTSQQAWPSLRADARGALPPAPQTAPPAKPPARVSPARAAAPRGAPPGLPWQAAAEPATPSRLPHADVLQVAHMPASPSTPSHHGLIPTPINYNYTFSNAPRTGGGGGKKAGARRGPATTPQVTSGGGGYRSASVDAGVRRSVAAVTYGSPSVLVRANSGNMYAETPPRSNGPTSYPSPARAPPKGASTGPPPTIPAPPPASLEAFPELAALEAQFLTELGLGEATPAGAGTDAAGTELGEARPPEPEPEPEPPAPVPEPKALSWAERNTWFGTDAEMTQYAYTVHDDLVGRQGYDAASDAYYEAIEVQVREQFPEKWQAWEASQIPEPQPSPSPQRKPPPPPPPPAPLPHFGAALKVSVKDPMPMGAWSAPTGPFKPQRGFSNSNHNVSHENNNRNRQAKAKPAAAATPKHASSIPSRRYGGSGNALRDRIQTYIEAADADSGEASPSATPGAAHKSPPVDTRTPLEASFQRQAAAGSPAVARRASGHSSASSPPAASTPTVASTPLSSNPDSSALPSPSSHLLAKGAAGGGSVLAPAWTTSAYGSAVAGRNMLARLDPFAGYAANEVGYRELQADYARQRQAMLDDLKRLKEDAEEERRKILYKIGNTLAASRWRS